MQQNSNDIQLHFAQCSTLIPRVKRKNARIYTLYFYFLHMNEEHLNIQQWNSKAQNTYNKHVQTKSENQLCNR